MASTIKIKRSGTATGSPASLKSGELAYTYTDGVNKLYYGKGDDGSGNATEIVQIAGQFFTDMLDHTAGTLTASSAIIVDSNSKIDTIKPGNLQLTGNVFSSTSGDINITPTADGDLILSTSGSGVISLAGQVWPSSDGSTGSFLKTDGSGNLSWAAVPSGSFTISDGTTSDTFTTGETLIFTGSGSVTTQVTNNQVTITGTDTTYSAGTGLSLSGTTFNHTNSITSGTVSEGGSSRTLSFGGTFNVPSVTYDAQGHVTGTSTVALTLPANPDTNTDTTYTVKASTQTGGASLDLDAGGSGSGTDSVTFLGSGGTTVTRNDADSITISSPSTVTVGTTPITLGSSSTSLAGITQLTVDNIDIDSNTISSTTGDIILSPSGSGSVDVANSRIIGVSAPINDTDAANKLYVDNAVSGLTWKQSVNLFSNSNISLTGTTNTLVIDGHAALTSANSGYRILVTGQSTAAQNGIYVYTDNGSTYTLDRSTDADVYTELVGATVFVLEGTIYSNTSWTQSYHYLTDFSGQVWTQFSGTGSYTAGDGLTQTGTVFNVGAGNGITVAADTVSLASTVAGNGLTYTNGVLDIVGTSNRISVSTNSIDIDSNYAGQATITTLGTITTGTWNGSTVGVGYGGTGVTTFTTNGILYGNGNGAVQVTAAGTDGYFLYSNGGTPAWTNTIEGGTY